MNRLLQLQSKRRFPEIGEAVVDFDLMTPAERVTAGRKRRLIRAVAHKCERTLSSTAGFLMTNWACATGLYRKTAAGTATNSG
jgi:hypothetical protein